MVISLDDISKPNLLAYGLTSGTPSISLPDTNLFKSERGAIASNFFKDKIDQLNNEYDRLITLAKYTDLVYNSKYNFIPTVGQVYHLYYTGEHFMLSMIEPERWDKYTFVASFKFTADNTWEIQDGKKTSDSTC